MQPFTMSTIQLSRGERRLRNRVGVELNGVFFYSKTSHRFGMILEETSLVSSWRDMEV